MKNFARSSLNCLMRETAGAKGQRLIFVNEAAPQSAQADKDNKTKVAEAKAEMTREVAGMRAEMQSKDSESVRVQTLEAVKTAANKAAAEVMNDPQVAMEIKDAMQRNLDDVELSFKNFQREVNFINKAAKETGVLTSNDIALADLKAAEPNLKNIAVLKGVAAGIADDINEMKAITLPTAPVEVAQALAKRQDFILKALADQQVKLGEAAQGIRDVYAERIASSGEIVNALNAKITAGELPTTDEIGRLNDAVKALHDFEVLLKANPDEKVLAENTAIALKNLEATRKRIGEQFTAIDAQFRLALADLERAQEGFTYAKGRYDRLAAAEGKTARDNANLEMLRQTAAGAELGYNLALRKFNALREKAANSQQKNIDAAQARLNDELNRQKAARDQEKRV